MLNFILILGLFVWVIVIQQKLDKISHSVDYLCRKSSSLSGNDAKNVEKVQQIEKFVDTKPVGLPEAENLEKPAVSESLDIKSVPEDKVVMPEVASSADSARSHKSQGDDLQSVFLGNLFNKIGALAIIIAAVIFIKLISPFIILTPSMKLLLGYLAGFGIAFGALFMHKKDKLKNYSEVLLGTGFAVLFITTFCGYSMFHLLATHAVITIGVMLLISAYYLADKMKTVSMLVLGLIGGYLTPAFSGADANTALGFVIFLNVLSLIYTLKNKSSNVINIFNLLITMFIFMVFNFSADIGVGIPLFLWGAYVIYDIFRNKSSRVDNSLIWINYAVLTLFSLLMFYNSQAALGWMFVMQALIYSLIALVSRISKNTLYKHYEHCVLANIWLFVLFIMNDIQSVITWSVVPFVVTVLVYKFKFSHLKNAVTAYYFTAIMAVLLASYKGENLLMAQYMPILNMRTLIFSVPVFSMFWSAAVMKNEDVKTYDLLRFSALSLVYIYLIGEVNSLMTKTGAGSAIIHFNKYMIYTILGFMYSLQLKKIYSAGGSVIFNIASYIALPVSVLMLVFGSYDYPDGYSVLLNMRVAAYAVAIAYSVVMAKWTKHDFYSYLAVFLGFLLCHSESAGISNLYSGFGFAISLGWVLYSGVVTVWGIMASKRCLINSGIIIFIMSIVRIFIFDLAKVDALYKLIAFLALGIILMVVSYIYTANKKS